MIRARRPRLIPVMPGDAGCYVARWAIWQAPCADTAAPGVKICLRDLAACFARGLACSFRPLQSESAGNAGRPMRPIAACAMIVVERTRVSQVTPEASGIPRAMVLRLMSRSPRRSGFFATVACGCCRKLDASVEASGPHDFAVRKQAPSSLAPLASTASRPASVTIASRPSVGRDGETIQVICVF